MRIKNKNSSNKKFYFLLIGVSALLLAAIVFFVLTKYNKDNNSYSTEISQGSTRDIQNKVDLSPPTEEQKKDGEATKTGTIEGNQPLPTDSSGKKIVSPIITASYVESGTVYARGYVSGVTENDGSCSFVFTKDSATKTLTSTGRADATTTVCPRVNMPSNSLSPGQWQVTLKYSSQNYSGTSEKQTLTIN